MKEIRLQDIAGFQIGSAENEQAGPAAPSSSVHRARPVAWISVAADRRAVKMRS